MEPLLRSELRPRCIHFRFALSTWRSLSFFGLFSDRIGTLILRLGRSLRSKGTIRLFSDFDLSLRLGSDRLSLNHWLLLHGDRLFDSLRFRVSSLRFNNLVGINSGSVDLLVLTLADAALLRLSLLLLARLHT